MFFGVWGGGVIIVYRVVHMELIITLCGQNVGGFFLTMVKNPPTCSTELILNIFTACLYLYGQLACVLSTLYCTVQYTNQNKLCQCSENPQYK